MKYKRLLFLICLCAVLFQCSCLDEDFWNSSDYRVPSEEVPGFASDAVGAKDYFVLRSRLQNSLIQFANKKKARVAFLGGSITNMNGWRRMTCQELERRFAEMEFDFVNAGIPSTDSTLGAFRLEKDVFSRGRVDLLFVEFAVNDLHNSRSKTERTRGIEGIIRRARELNPNIDIVMLYFIDPSYMPIINAGKTPEVIASHTRVAEYYNVPSIDLAREVTERIEAGEFKWSKFRDLHPSPFGHRLYADSIGRLLDAAWQKEPEKDAEMSAYAVPDKPLDQNNYASGRYIDIAKAKLADGWEYVESWNAAEGATRPRFVNVPMLVAKEAKATLKLKFEGTAIGLLEVAGPDVGIIEYSIDSSEFAQLDQFTRWSGHLHIPWAYMLNTDLKAGEHELILRTTGKKNANSKGTAARIAAFLAN